MTEPYLQEININQLLLDLENPRYDNIDGQREALITTLKIQNEKLINLIIDIANRGTNPFELIVVTPFDSKEDRFIVLEGNR